MGADQRQFLARADRLRPLPGAKERLAPTLSAGNRAKTLSAPVTAIIAYDTKFYDLLPTLFPHDQTARSWFAGEAKEKAAETAAFRNGSLQGAYFIIAARAVGLDCGPMSGFDNAKVDAAFFPTAASSRTSSATSATATPRPCMRVRRASPSTRPAGSSERP